MLLTPLLSKAPFHHHLPHLHLMTMMMLSSYISSTQSSSAHLGGLPFMCFAAARGNANPQKNFPSRGKPPSTSSAPRSGSTPRGGGDGGGRRSMENHYYVLFKPFNVLCQFSPHEGKRTLADVIKVGGCWGERLHSQY